MTLTTLTQRVWQRGFSMVGFEPLWWGQDCDCRVDWCRKDRCQTDSRWVEKCAPQSQDLVTIFNFTNIVSSAVRASKNELLTYIQLQYKPLPVFYDQTGHGISVFVISWYWILRRTTFWQGSTLPADVKVNLETDLKKEKQTRRGEGFGFKHQMWGWLYLISIPNNPNI